MGEKSFVVGHGSTLQQGSAVDVLRRLPPFVVRRAEPKPTTGSGDFMIGGDLWPGLSKLIEEAGEVIQVAGKLMGSAGDTNHWSGDLVTMLQDELGDLQAAIEFFVQANPRLNRASILARFRAKLVKFHEWHTETRERQL